MNALERYFDAAIQAYAPELPAAFREHRAVAGRMYRWDRAWPRQRLLIELQGGLWAKGRAKSAHAMPQGIQRDYEKNNAAVLAGFRVLYFSTEDVTKRPKTVAETVAAVFRGEVRPDGDPEKALVQTS